MKAEAISHQGETDQEQEAEREDLQSRPVIDELTDGTGCKLHDPYRYHHCSYHDGNFIDHANSSDD